MTNIGALPEHAGEVACTCGRCTMPSQGCCLSPFRSHGNQGRSQWLKELLWPFPRRIKKIQVSLTSVPGKAMEQTLLKAIFSYLKDKIIVNSWHGFSEGIYDSWLTLLHSAMRWMALWTRETVDIVYLDFSKAVVFHNVPIAKAIIFCLDKWTIRWMENWLNHQTQRVFISVTKFNWCSVTSGIPQG